MRVFDNIVFEDSKDYIRKKNYLTVFLIVQPLLDFNVFFEKEYFAFFNISLPTVVRYVFLLLFTLSIFKSMIYKKVILTNFFEKRKITIFLILCLLIIYLFSHFIFNIYFYDNVINSKYQFELIGEINFIIRITTPIIFFLYFILYDVRSNMNIIIMSWFVLIPGQIVILNLIRKSISSYSNLQVYYNFFDWFNSSISKDYTEIATKAQFRYANQISFILSALYPYFTYKFIKKSNKYNYLCLITISISMLMIGTKTAYFSIPILLMAISLYSILEKVIEKEILNSKAYLYILLILFGFVLISPYTPSQSRTNLTNSLSNSNRRNDDELLRDLITENEIKTHLVFNDFDLKTNSDTSLETSSQESKLRTVEDLISSKRVPKFFVEEVYPYYDDIDFWYEILHEPNSKLMNYRFLERSILNRIKNINNNSLESFLGMGYSRMQNLFALEQDFLSQFYTVGIFGILIFYSIYVLPIILLVHSLYVYYKRKEIVTTYKIIPLTYTILLAYSSGNILDSLFPTYITVFLISDLLTTYKEIYTTKERE